MSTTNKTTVSLVLGSGGARGLAHIGVIHWLEENNFSIKSIAGCSIGALIGGIYAAGKLNEFEQWVRAITKIDIVTLADLSWGKGGLVKGDKIIDTLIDIVGDQLIEDLPIPFTAVATDLKGHREVWIKSGKLFDAIRASISIPLFFTPFHYKGIDLIDGGVLNPVPIAPTFSDVTDLTIAVNLGGQPEKAVKSVTPGTASATELSPLREKITHFINHLGQSLTGDEGQGWGVYDIAIQAIEAMQNTIARQKLAAYPPDIVIGIARNACRTLEFYRATEIIELGYRREKECLSQAVTHQ